MGTPVLVFPLLAMQAWLGPPVTAGQTIGSVTSITAVTFGLWSLKVPFNFNPLSALMAMTTAWAAIVSFLYLTGTPAVVMSFAIAANAAFIFVQHRNFRPALEKTHGKLDSCSHPHHYFSPCFFLHRTDCTGICTGGVGHVSNRTTGHNLLCKPRNQPWRFPELHCLYARRHSRHCNIRRRGPLFARTDVDYACTCPQSPFSRCRKFCS